MISFSRAAARRFRSLLRRSVLAAAPRERCPPVLVTSGPEGTTLQAGSIDIGLVLRLNDEPGPVKSLTFPGGILSQVEGTAETPIVLEALSTQSARASWQEGPVPRNIEFAPHGTVPSLRVGDDALTLMPNDFLRALDDACRTAARESKRYAITHVQLCGKAGEIIATDGKQLLIQAGFDFPFTEDLLIPAVPVFNAKELTTALPVRLGRVEKRVVVQCGPWQVHLTIDSDGRYPDFRQVIPRGQPSTRLILDDADAEYLVDVLPGAPGADDSENELTLDLNGRAVARVTSDSKSIELELCGSRVSGKPVRLALNRAQFFRGLRLGFRSFEVFTPDKPIVGQEGNRILVLMTYGSANALPPSPDAVRLTTNGHAPSPPILQPERSPVMATTPPNGHATEPADTLDPLAEAESIKAGIQELLTRATRLVAYLKQFRRQRRTVESALQSLKSLQFGA